MRTSLAIKIFLSFWLIHALIFLVLGVVPDSGRASAFLDHARQDGEIAAGLYERYGAEDCARFLAIAQERSALQFALYDRGGRLLCGSAAPLDDEVYRRFLGVETDSGGRRTPDGRPFAVFAVAGPRQVRYTAAILALPGSRREPNPRPIPFGLLATAVVVSGLVCFLLARSLAAPLQRMRAATYKLKAGDLSARAGATLSGRRDEIGDVVRDFDSMAERIESLVHGQEQLLSDISHELRSPLARLNVALELARRTAGPSAEGHLGRIEKEAERMNDLIGQILLLARARDAGTMRAEDFDLGEMVRRIAADAQYEAGKVGARVVVTAGDTAMVHGDQPLLASAVENVIRNAVRHAPADTAIEVAVGCAGANGQVVIRDHGPGVPEPELERIFAPFHRTQAARDRESGGTGLGLSIAHRAVVTHAGTIAAENAEGGGLRVSITLPRLPAPPAARA